MSVYELASVITAHSWNKDGTRVAVCENEPEVKIYSGCSSPDASKWKVDFILEGWHTMVVTGIDWSHKSDKIVTCSHDVNAFVWTYDAKEKNWLPKVSILRIERAALRCLWSPNGDKFAVASSNRAACICYYQPTQDWWVSKLTPKSTHKSTVLDVAWHPSSQVFATACCDFKCRVISAFIPEVDKSGANTCFGDIGSMKFGQTIVEFDSLSGWVEAVKFSPSGNQLAFASHDSTVSFVDFTGPQPVCTIVKTNQLPYTALMFLNDKTVVAAGYGFEPEVFASQGSNQWSFLGSCDSKDAGSKAGPTKGFGASRNLFQSKVVKGTTGGEGSDNLKSLHHNVITDMVQYKDGFTTSAQDGRIVMWSKAAIKKGVPSISI